MGKQLTIFKLQKIFKFIQLFLLITKVDPVSNRRRVGVDVNHADRDGWSPLRSGSWVRNSFINLESNKEMILLSYL